MTEDEVRQVAVWLTEHGFTVRVDYQAATITIYLEHE